MKYRSTRDSSAKTYTAAEVIKMGLAPDGGLFLPTEIPSLDKKEVEKLCAMNYPQRAAYVLGKFLTDYTAEELLADCSAAYSENSFVGGAAPLHKVENGLYTLELWHGPTAAFKDMALQIMPRLLSRALKKTGETRTALILVATSGDTGKAALEGYKDIPGIKIMVFYPEDGVSTVQKLQMATQTGDNVNVVAIKGNFDDAQTGVKKIFGDAEMAKELNDRGYFLSSANSINWGRLAPQIVYYVSAYCDLLSAGALKFGEPMNITVPTGNFGNIFAAYIAKKMGLPIGKMVCASNKNNILTDFLSAGVYDRNRNFYLTMSPSMDILISSNLERLLFFAAGAERTTAYMKQLNTVGSYRVEHEVLAAIQKDFVGYFADEETCSAAICDAMKKNYLIDTHTAVGYAAALNYRKDSGDVAPMVVASTASPFKFAADVYRSLYGENTGSQLEALEALSKKTGCEIAYPLRGIGERKIRFSAVAAKEEMPAAVLAFAK